MSFYLSKLAFQQNKASIEHHSFHFFFLKVQFVFTTINKALNIRGILKRGTYMNSATKTNKYSEPENSLWLLFHL